MTNKILRIVFILFLIFSFCVSYVYATDINLDLPNIDDTTVSNENQEITDNTVTNDQSDGASIPNEPTAEEPPTEEITDDTNSTLGVGETETLQSSGISTASESGLGITNIINILLITVGVILVLLAIAIIIRLKN